MGYIMVDLMYEVSKIAQWMIFEKRHEKYEKKLIMICFDVPKKKKKLTKNEFFSRIYCNVLGIEINEF